MRIHIILKLSFVVLLSLLGCTPAYWGTYELKESEFFESPSLSSFGREICAALRPLGFKDASFDMKEMAIYMSNSNRMTAGVKKLGGARSYIQVKVRIIPLSVEVYDPSGHGEESEYVKSVRTSIEEVLVEKYGIKEVPFKKGGVVLLR